MTRRKQTSSSALAFWEDNPSAFAALGIEDQSIVTSSAPASDLPSTLVTGLQLSDATITPISTFNIATFAPSAFSSSRPELSGATSAMASATEHRIQPGVICYLPHQHEISSMLYIDDNLMSGAFNHPIIILSLGTDDNDDEEDGTCDIAIMTSFSKQSLSQRHPDNPSAWANYLELESTKSTYTTYPNGDVEDILRFCSHARLDCWSYVRLRGYTIATQALRPWNHRGTTLQLTEESLALLLEEIEDAEDEEFGWNFEYSDSDEEGDEDEEEEEDDEDDSSDDDDDDDDSDDSDDSEDDDSDDEYQGYAEDDDEYGGGGRAGYYY